MAVSFAFLTCALLFCSLAAAEAFGSESIFAIAAPPSGDEERALELKREQFWEPVLHAAEGPEEVRSHTALYAEAEAAIAGLSPEHEYVREAPPPGGRGLLAWALQRLAGFGGYAPRLRGDIVERQEGVLPALEGAASRTTGVLEDLHAASARSFDALKYDIYHQGAAKTPEAVGKIAKRVIDAVAETRGRFLKLSTASAQVVTRDTESEHADPSALVSQALLADMEPLRQGPEEERFVSVEIRAPLAPPAHEHQEVSGQRARPASTLKAFCGELRRRGR
eukprot:CAMPEP_0179070792 /NCGR_PEP_ID=MMETSP0796-20121207/31200_1 /TAXON_ID=73915 /ORGANISM="Pyrodinium bahamense, Strain pbaha01" /LENGTH=279 /DNA_ID=CAMNT_0020767889 /DNA_START=70 /DNA_END=906 /DNA_ORIENTATION=+